MFQITAMMLRRRPRSRWSERTKRRPFEPRLRREGAKLEHLSRARRRMKDLGRSGVDLGREGRRLSFHGARVFRSWWPVQWRQVLVGYGGATKEPRAQEKETRKQLRQLGSRRRHCRWWLASTAVGRAAAAWTLWCAVMGRRDCCKRRRSFNFQEGFSFSGS